MDSRRVERVEDWDSRSFSGGFEGLRSLSDAEFTGAVTTGTTWLFMLNGRIIGVFDGSIDDFDGASGTAYDAPHPSVPLLFAMQETGGEERANYYTKDTPVSEADGTLSSGSFTGYIELSENVLSGDYYVVYYGGRSMSCAFIGNQERLHTGDEAFQRADDEVGIYTVMDVDIEVTEIPGDEPEQAGDAGDAAAAGAAGGAANGGVVDEATGPDHAHEGTDPTPAEPAPDDGERAAGGTGGRDESAPPREEPTPATDEPAGATDDTAVVRDAEAPVRDDTPEPERSDDAEPASGRDRPTESDRTNQPGGAADARGEGSTTDGTDAVPMGPGDDRGTDPATTEDRAAESAATEATPAPPVDAEDRTGDTGADDGTDPVQIPDEVLEEVEREAAEEEDPVFEEEAEWRETRSIPSINPDHSESSDQEPSSQRQSRRQRQGQTDPTAAGGSSTDARQGNASQSGAGRSGTDQSRSPQSRGSQSSGGRQPTRSGSGSPKASETEDTDEPLEREMLQREDKIDRLQQQLSNVEEERTELREERDQLADENADLREEVEELEAEIAELEAELTDLEAELAAQRGPAADASVDLSPQQALEGTNLFVRYGSKGEATLDTAHDGDADADAVNANLRIEHHTQFEADDAAVEGRPYVDFLHESIEFRFVEWFVRDLLYEIRDTGNAGAMAELYDAIPDADRAELHGSVSLRYEEDGSEQREQTTFDVVVRDRMGNPLVVANLNDSRDPTTEEMMVDLQERASRVKRTSDTLAGAVVVTASFFDPGALETASEATSGSFLSRDSKKSFVKLSRKSGYHLCLVESRGGEFHINVPEL